MQKIKIMNLFCLPKYSILIGHYETTGLCSVFTLLSPMYICEQYILLWCWSNSFVWHVYWFVNIPIGKRLICVPIQIGVWYILAKNIAFWLVDLIQPFFRAWRDFTVSRAQGWFLNQQFCLTDLKARFSYATMNAWIQLWVQGEMCGNNTIKLEWYVSISP